MLKTTGSSEEFVSRAFNAGNNEVVRGGNRADKTVVGSSKSKNKKSRKLTCVTNIGATRKPNFLTSNAKKDFNYLRLAFIKVPILQQFDPKSYIQVETDASGYTIGRVLSQLNLDSNASSNDSNANKSNFGQWHSVAYFSRKIIPAETRYETHDVELLAIVEAFKTWRHYLKGCKHKVLVLTDYNNFCRFINIKSLSFCQIKWNWKLLKYHFQINYCQSKANQAADALSHFAQRSLNEKKRFGPKTLKLFIICSPLLQGPAFQASASTLSSTSHPSIKSSSAARTSYRSFVSFGRPFKLK